MKTSYILITTLALTSVVANAQKKDSLINRQVMLERDYVPTLSEASRVNVVPFIYEPELKKTEVKFVHDAPLIDLSDNHLGSVPSGDMDTQINFNNKRGYAVLGAGLYSSLDAAVGYRFVDNAKTQFDVYGTHLSTSGKVDYLENMYGHKEMQAKYGNNKINALLNHKFSGAKLSLDGSYNNLGYNYYGNSFSLTDVYNYTTNQNAGIFKLGVGLESNEDADALFDYKINMGYTNFTSKYGIVTSDKGPRGSLFNLGLDGGKALTSEVRVGAKAHLLSQSFNSTIEYMPNAFTNYANITLSPYTRIEGVSWKLDLGFNVHALFDVDNRLAFSPDINLWVKADEKNVFYAKLTGGVNDNTFVDILHENRYANQLLSKVEYSRTAYNATVGYNTGALAGFEFDIFGGYKQTKKDHLYLFSFPQEGAIESSWGNTSTPVYADISTGHVGALAKTSLIPHTTLSAKLVGYFYTVKYASPFVQTYSPLNGMVAKPWGRPSFTIDLNADVTPMDKLLLSVNYIFAGGRKTYFNQQSLSMNSINELNLKAEYTINDWVSVNARANNVLFQKYELQYGYALQGLNMMLGAAFKF